MPTSHLRSSLCTEETLTSEAFLAWADRMRPAWDHDGSGLPVYIHRKIWEWVFIAQALHERGMLMPGRRGLGFGVGQDPLAALFASFGCDIVATDVDLEAAERGGWAQTGQHAADPAQLNKDGLCDPSQFAAHVRFRTVDMNRIPADLRDFDFTWSACAFEHLGSIVKGQEFILNQMACLKPSGVAVHTTEYNVFSNRGTIHSGQTVLFRRADIEWLTRQLLADNHHIEVDFDAGHTPADLHVDAPPFSGPHLKLQLERYVTTSLGLIVEKSPWGSGAPAPVSLERRIHRGVGTAQALAADAATTVVRQGRRAAGKVKRTVLSKPR